MVKVKRRSNNNRDSGKFDVSEGGRYADAVDTSASNFINDEVDEYYAKEEREGMAKLKKLMRKPSTNFQEEVLGVASSSDDEERVRPRGKKAKKNKKASISEPLPAIDSDLEEDRKEEEEEQYTSQWGKKRSAYYNADYVHEEWKDGDKSDEDAAVLEEQEALVIQQRMAQQLAEDDFGLEFLTHLKEAGKVKEPETNDEVKIAVNFTELTKQGKLDLLAKESPELVELIEDFKLQMKELKENIEPLLKLIADGTLPPSPGVDFIKAKYSIIMNYCMQIGYYFILKSRRISVQNHPVIKRLVEFRGLLNQLETANPKFIAEMDNLLAKVKEGHTLVSQDFISKAPPKKQLRILGKPQTTVKDEQSLKQPVVDKKKKKPDPTSENKVALTMDEQKALEFYSAVRQRKPKDSEEESDGSEDEEMDTSSPTKGSGSVDAKTEETHSGKRPINYQIAKNKGLTPHRQKEQRNPRVKHRMKFRQANIRRKGQIREPRKELKRYAGELSGIKATVVRSVKLK